MILMFKLLIRWGVSDFILQRMHKMEDWYKWNIRLRIKHPNGAPYLCQNCGHDKTTYKVKDYINYTPCEEEHYCAKCNQVVGYWAYGTWQI